MKKTVLALLVILLLLAGCGKTPENTTTTSTETTTTMATETTLFTVPEGWTGDIEYEYSKHQSEYYDIPGFFSNLVDVYDYSCWIVDEKPIFDDFHEMALLQFIKRFDIPKETFAEVVEEYEKGSLADGFSYDEISHFNVEIIYSFDNKLISDYYREENPVAPDWLGTERAKDFTYESYSAYLEANPE